MTEQDPIGTWYGKPISEMEKTELLEVIRKLGEFHRQQERQHREDLDFMSSIRP